MDSLPWCRAVPSDALHPATHERVGLCDQHYTEQQRAALAYRKAKQRQRDGGGPNPGSRDDFIQARFTAHRGHPIVIDEEAAETLKWRLAGLSAASLSLAQSIRKQSDIGALEPEAAQSVSAMLAAAAALAADLGPHLSRR